MAKNRKTKAHSMVTEERTAEQKIESLKIETSLFRDAYNQLEKSKDALVESNITAQKNLKNLKIETSLFRDAYFQLKKSKSDLQESEERYRNLIEETPQMVQSVQMDGNFDFVNPQWRKVMGYSEKEIKKIKLWDIIHPSCMTDCRDKFKKVMEGKEVKGVEATFVRKDGALVYVEGGASPRLKNGKVIATQGFFMDVTERKKTEKEIEALSRFPMESPSPVLRASKTGLLLYANPASKALLTAIKVKVGDILPNPFKKLVRDTYLSSSSSSSSSSDFELSINNKFYYIVFSAVKTSNYINLYFFDATARKKAEESLRRTETKFRSIFEGGADGIMIADIKTKRFTMANPAICRFLGYQKEELLRLRLSDLHPKASLPWVLEQFAKLSKGILKTVQDIPFLRKDGLIVYADVVVSTLVLGGKLHSTGFFRDATERRKAQEKMRFFELAVQSSSDAIGMSTPDGKHYYQNKAFDDLFGNVGESPPATLYVDEQVGRKVFQTIMGGNPWIGEVKMRGKAGKLLDIFLRAYAIKDDTGRILGLVGVHTNITERKKAEILLQKSHDELENRIKERTSELSFKNAFLNMELENSLDGILITDSNGKILSANKRFAELWGIPQAVLSKMDDKRPPDFVLNQLQNSDEYAKMTNRLQANKTEKFRILLKFKDMRVFDCYTAPLKGEDGKYYGRLWSFRDMTHEAEVDRAKSEFVSLASHQLRTPLTAIKWLIQVAMKKGSLNKTQKEFLDDALSSNDRMINLVNDLLNVSRLETGILTVNPVQGDVNKLLKELINEVKPTALKKRINIKFPETKVKLMAYFDSELVSQVVSVFLTNAIDYSEEKKPITVSLRKKKNNFEISVHDNGVGISKSDQKNLFNKFFRSAEAAKLSTHGSGLGLYIVKRILDVCKGNVRCDSVLGKGSTFTVSFPLKMKGIGGGKTLIRDKIS